MFDLLTNDNDNENLLRLDRAILVDNQLDILIQQRILVKQEKKYRDRQIVFEEFMSTWSHQAPQNNFQSPLEFEIFGSLDIEDHYLDHNSHLIGVMLVFQ